MLSMGDMRYKGVYALTAMLGYCGALILLAIAPWFGLALVAAALLGVTDSIQMVARNSTIIGMSPDTLRGRVEAFRTMLAGGGPPLGYTLSGSLASAFGPAVALVIGAVGCMAIIVSIGLRQRELRDPMLGATPESGPTAPEAERDGASLAAPVR
jgi:MFS family permease